MTEREVIAEAVTHARRFGRYPADVVIEQLLAAGYYIVRMPGGVHEGTCPTCGCEPTPPPPLKR